MHKSLTPNMMMMHLIHKCNYVPSIIHPWTELAVLVLLLMTVSSICSSE